jgi:hypothetical protein
MTDRQWRFQFRSSGVEWVKPLWLYPEIDGSSCVDDADDQSGPGQLAYFVRYVKRRHPERWHDDAVPIYWGVCGDGVCEFAPTDANDMGTHSLTVFTPPVDAKTGEPLNWWKLPVRNDRFPAFAKALGWLPSPFQKFAPLRSIITNAPEAARKPRRIEVVIVP